MANKRKICISIMAMCLYKLFILMCKNLGLWCLAVIFYARIANYINNICIFAKIINTNLEQICRLSFLAHNIETE